MQPNTKKRWTLEEEEIFSSLLKKGADLNEMLSMLPDRNKDSILRRASSDRYAYGYTTVNGNVKFYPDIKRNTNKKNRSGILFHLPMEEVEIVEDINDIVPIPSLNLIDKGLAANTLAIEILQQYNLSINPKILMCLSVHILENDHA